MKKVSLVIVAALLIVSGVSAQDNGFTVMYGTALTAQQDKCFKEKSAKCPNMNIPAKTTIVFERKREFQPDAPAGEPIPNVKSGVRDGWECRKEALSSCGVDVPNLQVRRARTPEEKIEKR
ncbi:MAG: hypothetical protein LBF37_01830 [Rickettsiales bacterium]|jgi:hypothetical protein|nr:hypothetical protein [Rickettsiales bacterium]